MENLIEELRSQLWKTISTKTSDWKEKVYDSQQYQQELKFSRDMTYDFVNSLRSVAFYSTRAGDIYVNFLTIHAIDDLLQSAIGILSMLENGIYNPVKRELRYLIEMMTKFVIVDYDKMGESLKTKTEYLNKEIPNSSIEIIDNYNPPFKKEKNKEFKNEVKDFFYKSCAYVHPSKKQVDEQIRNYTTGNTIGFESAKMFGTTNKLLFRAYDMILTMIFHGFGLSMSGDLFIQLFDENSKWKFHKGKYVRELSKLFDYKQERK